MFNIKGFEWTVLAQRQLEITWRHTCRFSNHKSIIIIAS